MTLCIVLLTAGCEHAPAPEERPVTKGDRPHRANVQSAVVIPPVPVRPAFTRPHFAVQVAAYDQRSGAEALAFRLSAEYGLQTLVAPVEMHGTTYYRVRIMVETKDLAESLVDAFLCTKKLKVWAVPLR